MNKRTSGALLGSSLLALSGLLAAHAAATANDQLQEVVITAQKKTENLQKAAIAVEVLRPADLANAGIKNPVDLQEIMPAVKFVDADVITVQIRGLGTTDANPGVDSAVAYVQDGVYLSHPNALSPVMFDIKDVETALGPQGTLYGRNSDAGAISRILRIVASVVRCG